MHSQRLEISRVKFKGDPFTWRLSARSKDPNSFIWKHFFTVLLIFIDFLRSNCGRVALSKSNVPVSSFLHPFSNDTDWLNLYWTFRLIEFVFLSLRFLLSQGICISDQNGKKISENPWERNRYHQKFWHYIKTNIHKVDRCFWHWSEMTFRMEMRTNNRTTTKI